MIEILPESTDTSIGFKISGKLTGEDYENLLPKVDQAIAAHGHINLLVLMEDFEGKFDFDAAKADFQFGTHQYRQVEKAAFVSDKNWLEWIVKIMDPFTRRVEEKFFETQQLKDAWAWIFGEEGDN
jgi:hypothetical protein